jgi:hypothetical protein
MLIPFEIKLCKEVRAKLKSVEVRLASGRETAVPHPAIWVDMLRCCDDLCDREVSIMRVANTRGDATEPGECSMDLQKLLNRHLQNR